MCTIACDSTTATSEGIVFGLNAGRGVNVTADRTLCDSKSRYSVTGFSSQRNAASVRPYNRTTRAMSDRPSRSRRKGKILTLWDLICSSRRQRHSAAGLKLQPLPITACSWTLLLMRPACRCTRNNILYLLKVLQKRGQLCATSAIRLATTRAWQSELIPAFSPFAQKDPGWPDRATEGGISSGPDRRPAGLCGEDVCNQTLLTAPGTQGLR